MSHILLTAEASMMGKLRVIACQKSQTISFEWDPVPSKVPYWGQRWVPESIKSLEDE